MKWFLDMDLTKYFLGAFLRIVRKLGKTMGNYKVPGRGSCMFK